jgi:hypothetical protein
LSSQTHKGGYYENSYDNNRIDDSLCCADHHQPAIGDNIMTTTTIGTIHDACKEGTIEASAWYTDKIINLEELCEVARGDVKLHFIKALGALQDIIHMHKEIYPEDF